MRGSGPEEVFWGHYGRLAQRESTALTTQGSAVRTRHRPPANDQVELYFWSTNSWPAKGATVGSPRVVRGSSSSLRIPLCCRSLEQSRSDGGERVGVATLRVAGHDPLYSRQ